jgi:hypothetical protein
MDRMELVFLLLLVLLGPLALRFGADSRSEAGRRR